MKTILYYYLRLVLHYLWLHREQIFYIVKNKKYDGKITVSDIFEMIELYKKSGLTSTQESEEEEMVFTAGDINQIKKNTSKNLVQYDQSSRTCVLYSIGRMLMYNTKIILTKEEHEIVKKWALDKKLWKDGDGMTFVNGLKIWAEYLKVEKNIEVTYIKEPIGSTEHLRYKNELEYMALIGGYICSEFIADFKTDGIVDGPFTGSEKKLYGHAFTDHNSDKNETDNYPTKFGKNNRRKNILQKTFITNKYYFPYAYFMLATGEINIDAPKSKERLLDSAKKAQELGIWDGSEAKKPATREEVASMVYRATKLVK